MQSAVNVYLFPHQTQSRAGLPVVGCSPARWCRDGVALAYASEDLRGDAEVLAAAAGNTQRQVEVTPSFWTREPCQVYSGNICVWSRFTTLIRVLFSVFSSFRVDH